MPNSFLLKADGGYLLQADGTSKIILAILVETSGTFEQDSYVAGAVAAQGYAAGAVEAEGYVAGAVARDEFIP